MRAALATAFAVLAALAASVAASADVDLVAPAKQLQTSFIEPEDATTQTDQLVSAIKRTGAKSIRIYLSWYSTAPGVRPAGFNAENPNDPAYNWSAFDAKLKFYTDRGLTPIVAVRDGPDWARIKAAFTQSPVYPTEFGQFMKAAAQRYSGNTPGVPRVSAWQIWVEPNLTRSLAPQYDLHTNVFNSPDEYRDMVNAAYDAVKSVAPSELIVAGGLAPFRDITPNVLALDQDWGPIKFMRRLLCVDDAGNATCSNAIKFDVWATNPYTSGGPLHKAALPYDLSLGDLPKMRAVLSAAVKAGHVQTSLPHIRFWVTEFSWDSNAPDPCSPPLALLARWIPEGLYRMWLNGADLVVWLQVQDEPMTSSFYQSGFFFTSASLAGAKPKPTLEGFRFPFVAYPRGKKSVYVWARTPNGTTGRVLIQQKVKSRWVDVTRATTTSTGILSKTIKAKPNGLFRARLFPTNETSLPYSMQEPKDQFFNPFGQPTLLEPTNAKQCVQPGSKK